MTNYSCSSCANDSELGACISSDHKKCWDDTEVSECRGDSEWTPGITCADLGYTCPEGMICFD